MGHLWKALWKRRTSEISDAGRPEIPVTGEPEGYNEIVALDPDRLLLRDSEALRGLTQQMAVGGGIAFLGSVIGKVSTFGLFILIGRVLGPGAYGLYALGTSLIRVAQTVASLGLNEAVIRFCAMYRGEQDNKRVKETFLTALAISLAASVLLGTVLFMLSRTIAQQFFHKPDLEWILRVFAIALPVYVWTGITASFAQAFQRMEYQQGVQNIFRPLASLALVGLAFLLGFRLAGAVYAFLVSGVLGLGLGFYFSWRVFPEMDLDIHLGSDELGKLMHYALPMMFVAIFYSLAIRTDRLMLGLLGKAADVGIYDAAANVALQVALIHGALVSIFAPIISDVYNRQRLVDTRDLYHVVTRWSSYGTLLLALPVLLYPKSIMSIYGSEFAGGWLTLVVLSIGYVVGSVAGPTGALLQMTGRQKIEFVNGLSIVTLNVILNYFFIPVYGYLGAALATSLSTFVWNMIQIGQIYRFFRFHPFHSTHMRFVGLASVIFGVSVAAGVYLTPAIKLLLLLGMSILMLTFYYTTRTQQDRAVWETVRLRLTSEGVG